MATSASAEPTSHGTRSRCGSSTSESGEVVKTRARGESYDSVGLLRNDSRKLSADGDLLGPLGSLSTLEASFDSLLKEGCLDSLGEGEQLFGAGAEGTQMFDLAEYRSDRHASWDGSPLVRVDRSGSLESCCSSNSGWSSSGLSSSSDAEAGTSSARPKSKVAWTNEEDQLIAEGVRRYGNKWSRIVEMLPTAQDRTDDAVRNRWQRLQRKQKRQEAMAARGGRAASGDYGEDGSLAPSKHGDMWTKEEDLTIDEGVKMHGFKWRAIAAVLPGRTESGCRNRWIRNQERALDARGIRARGAQEVIAALHKSGELRQNGSSSAYPPVYYQQPGSAADAAASSEVMDDEPLFPPPPDEPLFPAAAASHAQPLAAAGSASVAYAAPPPSLSPPAAAYPWESSAAIQALRRDSSSVLTQPEMILRGP